MTLRRDCLPSAWKHDCLSCITHHRSPKCPFPRFQARRTQRRKWAWLCSRVALHSECVRLTACAGASSEWVNIVLVVCTAIGFTPGVNDGSGAITRLRWSVCNQPGVLSSESKMSLLWSLHKHADSVLAAVSERSKMRVYVYHCLLWCDVSRDVVRAEHQSGKRKLNLV